MTNPAAAAHAASLRRLFFVGKRANPPLDADGLRNVAAARGMGDSLRALTARQLDALAATISGAPVMAYRGDGGKNGAAGAYLQFRRRPAGDKYKLLAKLSRQLAAKGAGWEYADSLSRRMGYAQTADDCSPQQLHRLVAEMAQHAARHNK